MQHVRLKDYMMTEERRKLVQYVKTCMEDVIEVAQKLSKIDYSVMLGRMLEAYLQNPADQRSLTLSANVSFGLIETEIIGLTGNSVSFQEPRKCGIAIHRLWRAGDTEGLEELEKYANGLINGSRRANVLV